MSKRTKKGSKNQPQVITLDQADNRSDQTNESVEIFQPNPKRAQRRKAKQTVPNDLIIVEEANEETAGKPNGGRDQGNPSAFYEPSDPQTNANSKKDKPNAELKNEENNARSHEPIKITFPYECKEIVREMVRQAPRFVSELVEALKPGISSLEIEDTEKLKKIHRRLINFSEQISKKMMEICDYEKNYGVQEVIKIGPIDQNLVDTNAELRKTFEEILQAIAVKRKLVEETLSTAIAEKIDGMLTNDIIDDPNEKFTIKYQSKSSPISFNSFLNKYIGTQKMYFSSVQQSAKMLDESFDALKIESIKRFKKVTRRHTELEMMANLGFMRLSDAESIVMEDF